MTRLALCSLTILQSMPQFDLKGIFSSLCSGMQRLHFLPEKGATDWYSELVSGRPSLQELQVWLPGVTLNPCLHFSPSHEATYVQDCTRMKNVQNKQFFEMALKK